MVDWKERYMREVEGLNNEGDPIGGDPPSGLRHQVEVLKAENEAQAKLIAELEAATEHLGLTPQQAKDGLARHKAQVAEIESLRKQVDEHKEWHMMRDEMRKALEAQMNG